MEHGGMGQGGSGARVGSSWVAVEEADNRTGWQSSQVVVEQGGTPWIQERLSSVFIRHAYCSIFFRVPSKMDTIGERL